MSIVIATYVPEGIVLAADSRLTLTWTSDVNGKQNVNSAQISDTTDKLFLLNDRIGLSTFGAADIGGIPIAGFVSQFIEQKINDQTEVDQVGRLALDFFRGLKADLNTFFYVAGYKKESGKSMQHIYHVDIKNNQVQRLNQNASGLFFGANWGGEIEVISRLVGKIKVPKESDWVELGEAAVAWNFLTMQDAIDFCTFAVRTTIESFRFQQRIKTVGGPVDVLVIRPTEGVSWISKKELHS